MALKVCIQKAKVMRGHSGRQPFVSPGDLSPQTNFSSTLLLSLKFPDCDKIYFCCLGHPLCIILCGNLKINFKKLIIYSFMGSLSGFLSLFYIICMWGQFETFLSKGMGFPFCAFWRSWNSEQYIEYHGEEGCLWYPILFLILKANHQNLPPGCEISYRVLLLLLCYRPK